MDIVERELDKKVSERSGSILNAMDHLNNLKQKIIILKNQIDNIRFNLIYFSYGEEDLWIVQKIILLVNRLE